MSDWKKYSDVRPQSEGVYQWRVKSNALEDAFVTFYCQFRERSAGYEKQLSPSFDHWDGYNLNVPNSTEWRECEDKEIVCKHQSDYEKLAVDGLSFSKCLYCEQIPVLKGVRESQWGGIIVCGEPHMLNKWWLSCCRWGNTPHLHDPRIIEEIRLAARSKAREAA